jgi:hypothetical protein
VKNIFAHSAILIALFIAPAAFSVDAIGADAQIKLKMYVVKATGSGEAGEVPSTLNDVAGDLKGTGFSNFELVTSTSFSLPAGASEDHELAEGYSVNVSPKGDDKSASVQVKFHKGTKKVFSGSSAVTAEKHAMFILRGVYAGGALIVIFTLE